MESREAKAEQRQQPVTPKKRGRPKPEKSAQANGGGSSSSAAESSPLSRTSSSSPPSDDADGEGQQQQQQHHEQGGGGKKPRLVWTNELHRLFLKAYDSLEDEAVPRRILDRMNEMMNVPEVSREKVASHLQKHKINLRRLAEQASSLSPTEEAPACDPLHPLPPNPRLAEVPHQAQLELVPTILVPDEADTEEAVTRIAQAAEAENAAEPEEAAPTPTPTPGSILGQFWASPDNNEASTSSWDIFGLSRGTSPNE